MEDAADIENAPGFKDRFISAQDGLKLHVRDYPARSGDALPVICLPGLTRSVRDFHDLALMLANHPKHPRRVISVDYRGRGASGYDRDWKTYNVLTELSDVIAILTALDIHHAGFIGTSRGGILIMLMGAMRPGAVKCAILNDVGPIVDVQGLLRIKRMLADLKAPASWDEAIAGSKRYGSAAFPEFTDDDWDKMARQTYRDEDGKPMIDFDRALAKTLAEFDPDTPAPNLWPQFLSLSQIPTLVIRGELSGILSEETLSEMKERHGRLDVHIVENEGHAPTLWDEPTQDRIARFITDAEAHKSPS